MSRLLMLLATAVPQHGDCNRSIASILQQQLTRAMEHVLTLRKLETDIPEMLCHTCGAYQVTSDAHERMLL